MAENIGTAYIQILPSFKGLKSNLVKGMSGDTASAGEKIGKSMSDGASKSFGSGFASKIKGIIAAAGIGKAIGASLSEGAKLQQSLGGIETLYKNAAGKMKKYASESFKTTGLSANEYMEQVTSFSASMVSSLGGNTQKAADLSNQAMKDMSDNANKMGTDMSSITQTYQSLARGNYAMLDNLKLGYGGTKTEMQRLLKDAQKITGIKYDMSKFSDVTQAIHVIQTQLGITGTTAKEAATTFSGSFAQMKAAATDLLGNLALGKNITPALNNLLSTTKTFVVGNFLPMVGQLMSSVGQVITEQVPKIGPAIQGALMSLLNNSDNLSSGLNGLVSQFGQAIGTIADQISMWAPQLLTTGLQLVANLSKGFVQGFPQFVSSVGQFFQQFLSSLGANMPQIISSGAQMISNLIQGFTNSLPTLISNLSTILSQLATIIIQNAPQFIAAGVKLIAQLAVGLVQAIPSLIAGIGQIIVAIVKAFGSYDWGSAGHAIINGLKAGLSAAVGLLASVGNAIIKAIVSGVKALPGALKSLGSSAIKALGSAISSAVGSLGGIAKSILTAVVNGIKSLPSKLASLAKSAVTSLAKGLSPNSVTNAAKAILTAVVGAIKALPGKLASLAKSAISSMAKGLASNPVVSKAKALLTGAVNAVKSLPSKLLSIATNAIKSMAGAIKPNSVTSKMRTILTGAVNAIKSLPSKLMSLARSAISSMARAITPNTVTSKMRSIGTSIVSTVKGIPGQMASIGSNIVSGLGKGISGAMSGLLSKVQSLGSKIKGALKKYLKIGSPSRVMRDEVGRWIPAGVAEGITKNTKVATNAVERMGKAITSKAKKSTKNVTKKASKSASKTVKNATKKASKSSKKSGSSGISEALNVIGDTSHYKTTTKKKKDKKTKKTKTVKSSKKLTDDQYGSSLLSNARSRVAVLESANKISYKQEVKYWAKIRGAMKKGSKAYNSATVLMNKAKSNKSTASKKAQDAFNQKQENYISNMSDQLELSQKERGKDYTDVYKMNYWKKAMKNVKKGSSAWKTAYSNMLEARNNTRATVKTLGSDFKSSIKEINKTLSDGISEAGTKLTENINSVNDQLAEDIQSVNTKLAEDIQTAQENLQTKTAELMDKYNSAVSERANEIANAFNITDKVELNLKTGKKTLMKNMQDQVNTYARYADVLNSLRSKLGDNSDLYKQLLNMGPKDVKTLESFNSMTSSELGQYSALLAQKNAISQQIATSDNQTLLQQTQAAIVQAQADTNAQIVSLQSQASAQIATLRSTAAQQIAAYRTEYANTVAELKAEAKSSIDAAAKTYADGLNKAGVASKKKAKQIGKHIAKGIAKGMIKSIPETNSAANQLCSSLIAKTKSILGIASPSKVFAKEVGKFIPLGMAKGINRNTDAVQHSISDMADNSVATAQSLMDFKTAGIASLPTAQAVSEGQAHASLDTVVTILQAIRDKDTSVYLDSRKVSKELAKPMNRELGALKKWQS